MSLDCGSPTGVVLVSCGAGVALVIGVCSAEDFNMESCCCVLKLPGARFDDGAGGDNEVQRTMLELINQLDGFDPRGNIKVLMATNRPDTLDPALMRPGRLDRKIEFSLPDLEVS